MAKDFKNNFLIGGNESDPLLYKKEIVVSDVRWVAGLSPNFPLKCEVRLRHRQALQTCELRKIRKCELRIAFDKPQRAPTPGQFAVFYSKGECLGGGVI